jgi:hypothetical protein
MEENMNVNYCTPKRILLHTALFMILGCLIAIPVSAQEGTGSAQEGTGMQAQQPEFQDFDDQTLDQYASSLVELQNIRKEFVQKLENVQEQEQAVAIQKEMNTKMVDAVQEQGLDVDTFNTIANQASADKQLQKRINEMVEQKRP